MRRALVVLAAGVLSVGALTASTTTSAVADTTAETATVTGTVLTEDGEPIASRVEVSPWAGGTVRSATPDAEGRFTITGVPAGTHSLTATATEGYHVWSVAYWDGAASTTDYSGFEVTAGSTVDADLVLEPASGIVGVATDEAGEPLQNVGWTVLTWREEQQDWFGPQMGPLLTDEQGRFWWRGTPGGRYKVCFYDDWYVPEWKPEVRYAERCLGGDTEAEAEVVELTEAEPRREVTVALPVAGLSLEPVTPFVTGTLAAGETVTVDPGPWAPSGVALSYRWFAWDGGQRVELPGSGATFTPTAEHDGLQVSVEVSGARDGYATARMTEYVGTVGGPTPTMTGDLEITGTPQVGQTLTVVPGAITPAPTWGPLYTWTVDGVPSGQGMSSYDQFEVLPEHAGQRIGVRMYASPDDGGNTLRVATETGPVAAG